LQNVKKKLHILIKAETLNINAQKKLILCFVRNEAPFCLKP